MSVAVPARGRRHPVSVMMRARELSSGGWSADRIVEMLARDGVLVARSTVNRWTNAKQARAATRRDHKRRAEQSLQNGMGPMGHPLATTEYKLGRMRALRDAVQLKDAQIARLMAHDFGERMTDDMVTHALLTGRYPRSLR